MRMVTAEKKAFGRRAKRENTRKKDGAPGLRIVPSVLAAAAAAVFCFLMSTVVAAAVMYALDAPFEKAYLGYLAAAGIASAVSSAVFTGKSGLSPLIAAPVWALAAVAFHMIALGILSPRGAHRLPILLTAAAASLLFGFLFAKIRKD